jgi:hypothetical protein
VNSIHDSPFAIHDFMLVLKIILVPSLIAAITLATRRWGPRLGGFLTALPVVTGPTLCFYAVEQGRRFGAHAATGTLLALTAVVSYAVTYARVARHTRWALTLAVGWVAFLVVVAGLFFVPQSPYLGLPLVALACALGVRLLPPPSGVPPPVAHPWWDLPLRMIAAAALVLVLTSVAAWLGPSLSGLLTPFPLATALLAAFTHAQRGPDAVLAFFHGFLPALVTFAVFCFTLAVLLPIAPLAVAVAAAFGAQLVLQGVLYRWRHADAVSLAE